MKLTAKASGSLLVCWVLLIIAETHGKMAEEEVLKLKWKQLNESKIDEELFKKMNNMHAHYYIGAVRGLLGAVGGEIYQRLPPVYKQELATCLNAIKDEHDLVAGAKCVSLAYELEDKAKQTWVGGFAMAKETEKSAGERPQQQVPIFKQADQNSVIIDSTIQRTLHPSPSRSLQADSGTNAPSIIKPISEVLFKSEYTTEPNFDNSTKATWRRKESKESLSRALKNGRNVANRSSKNMAEAWNARSLKLHRLATGKNTRYSPQKMNRVFEKKNIQRFWREDSVPWRRLRRSPHRLGNDDAGLLDVVKLSSMPNLMGNGASGILPAGNVASESPVVAVTKFLTQLVTGRSMKNTDGRGWKATSAKLNQLKKQMSVFNDINNPKSSEETYTQRRLYDIVTNSGNYHSKISKQQLEAHLRNEQEPLENVPLIKDALKLVEVLSTNNISQSARFLSPRIAPIMKPETKGVEHILSPSLFSFYRDDSPNNIASMPEILGAAGLNEHDQDTMMELAMELSGARAIIDKLFDNVDNPKDAVGLSSDILSAVGLMSDTWTQFGSSFDDRQKDQLGTKGYAFMDRKQIEMFYGRDGLYNYTNTDTSKLDVSHLTEEEMRNAMRLTIRKIAGELPLDENDEAAFQFSTSHHHRAKRTLTDVINQPIILTPFAFAPTILKNTILGPTILSPNIFSPFIINPQYFSPAILSPTIANPYILSPYLFGPFVLNPGVFVPFILSPYVLSPFILSPLVLTPFVLSPYVLSPNILNPYVLSPVILTPTVLSPDILSSTVLGGSILSPTVLSPAVLTEYYLGANVLSPTFLSRKKRNVHFKRRFERLKKMKLG
uniref:Uncharacterized protein n=1 Tax=Plectus sambesii TaxID=2011161 RepID=A0A914WK65_9BILA